MSGEGNSEQNEAILWQGLVVDFSGRYPWGGGLGWYSVWKERGQVSRPLRVGFEFCAGPISMLEPDSWKMAAVVAISWP
jgi:hypothetical protein